MDTNEATQRVIDVARKNSFLRERFIAVLGPDLRDPRASISSGIHLLTDREALTAEGKQILTLMHGSVVHASELIDNVLDFARGWLGEGRLADKANSLCALFAILIAGDLLSTAAVCRVRSRNAQVRQSGSTV